MAIGKDGAVLRHFQALFRDGTFGDLTDGQLLERFVTGRDGAGEMAFSLLVERHGAMVLRVCRAVLGDSHDAQDAFQATFLVLVAKARGLWVRDSLGPWLYQVAHRTAKCARSRASRRNRLERRAARTEIVNTSESPFDEREQVLHEEIDRLPERYRAPLVLCDLEGCTHEQAARHLGWPIGTVKSRQSRGRERLRERLARRGMTSDAGMLILALKPGLALEMLPPALVNATARAAVEFLVVRTLAQTSVALLTREVLESMSLLKWWKAATLLIALTATVSGAAVFGQKQGGDDGGTKPILPAHDVPSSTVKAGKFRATIIERGSAEAGKTLNVSDEVEGSRRILSIVPEGSRVKKGDKVCELDSSDLKMLLHTQEIATRKAEEASDEAADARQEAELARKAYIDGTYPLEVKALEEVIVASDATIKKAEARLGRTKAALDRVISTTHATDVLAELELSDRTDKIELQILKENAARYEASGKLEFLKRFTRERVERGLANAIKRARSIEFARQQSQIEEQDRLARLRVQIAHCTFLAPIDGLLVYANDVNDVDDNGRRIGFPVREGAKVRERQILFSVVDVDGPMRVNAKIHESIVDQLKVGQVAKVSIDALPGREMTGVVRVIHPVPDASSAGKETKFYTAYVEINERSLGIRPGMSARVEIVLSESDNAIAVPLAAVVARDHKYFVAVKAPEDGFEWREVKLGASDKDRIEIKEGLREGEIVAEDAKLLLPKPLGPVK